MTAQSQNIKFIHSIKGQLLLFFLALAIIPILVVGGLLYYRANNALQTEAYAKLGVAQQIKKGQIQKYFTERTGDIAVLVQTVSSLRQETLKCLSTIQSIHKTEIARLFKSWEEDVLDVSSDPGVVAGLKDLTAGFKKLGAQKVTELYNGKGELNDAGDGSAYSAAQAEQHAFFPFYTNIHHYTDAYLIDPQGNVVYSVHKGDFFGKNLADVTYQNDYLGQMYLALKDAPLGKTYTTDVMRVDNKMALFIGTPVYDGPQNIGLLVYQISPAQLNAIVQQRFGMGQSGETYLIAKETDGRQTFRSDMLTIGDGAYVVGYDLTSAKLAYWQQALDGKTGQDVFIDSNNNSVLVAFAPLNLAGLNWAIISKVNLSEVLIPPTQNHEKDFFTQYKELYGYADLLLIASDGNVFYSVQKEADYNTNLLTGPYKDSGLGRLVGQIIQNKQFGFADFAPYAPSNNQPSAFIAQPVIHNDNVEIIVALQLPLSAINSIMQERSGMGQSGETYLIGPDKLMRSDSFLDPQNHSVAASFAGTVEQNGVDTVASREALADNSGQQLITDYTGTSVLSAYDPLDVYGTQWAIIAEINQAEAFAPAYQMLTLATGVLVVVIGLVVLAALIIASRFAAPIKTVTAAAQHLATGDVELTGMNLAQIAAINARRDELGATGHAFSNLIVYLKEMTGAAQAITNGDLTVQVQPQSSADLLGNAFKQMVANLRQLASQVTATANNVNSASAQLSAAADQSGQATAQVTVAIQEITTGIAQQTKDMSQVINTVAQVTQAIDGVARGAQEQAAAVARSVTTTGQITKAVEQVTANAQVAAAGSAQAAQVARTGAATIQATIAGMQSIKTTVGLSAQKVQEMGHRSQQVGAIVETIDDIASQTNLLALNAAIEAARAGEHGKGFAVVADEVRKLAEKSATATKEIGGLIRGIQQTVTEAVQAMAASAAEVETGVTRTDEAGQALQHILQAAEQVNQQVGQIAVAAGQMNAAMSELVGAMETVSAVVEENTASTEEMAAGATEVSGVIENLSSISQENSAAIEEVSASAEEVHAQVEEVTASAQALNEMAVTLTALVAQFKLAHHNQ